MKRNVLGISMLIIGYLAVPAQSQDRRYPGPEQVWVQARHQGVDDHRSGFHEQGMTPQDSAKVWVDNGYISYWLTTYRGILGSLDEDLIGEATATPVCEGQSLGSGAAGSMYWYSYGDSEYSYQYNAVYDSEACSTQYNDIVRYFYTQVRVGSAKDFLLSFGHDDGMKIWLNGVEIYRGSGGVYEADSHQLAAHLEPGWNSILVKNYYPDLSEDAGYRYFSLRFLKTDGVTPVILNQAIDGWCEKDEGANWIYLGGVAELPGALGSQWSSDLRLTNTMRLRTRVTVEYFREGNAGAAKASIPDASVKILMNPGESVVYPRVLSSLFGMTGEKGMLAIRGFDRDDARDREIGLRTYNRSGSGTFGMDVPPLTYYDGSNYLQGTLYGLKNGPGFRTNFGGMPFNLVGSGIDLRVTIYDPVSGRQGIADLRVDGGYFQINDIFQAAGLADVETDQAIAFISGSNDDSSVRWAFYASVNDNVTSDPSYLRKAWGYGDFIPDSP